MINQITNNSNNVIQLSRGELLTWVNTTLKINFNKIQQLGTGAAYCQLLDVLYPGKVALSKVNWKAKSEYEFLNNFKVLQQSFTKFGINKNIEIQKLIKCKYQDNLEFLQWFKKIFDTTNMVKQYDPIQRRGETEVTMITEKKKETLKTSCLNLPSASINNTQRSMNDTSKISDKKHTNQNISFEDVLVELNKSKNQNESIIKQQKQFYFMKIKDIDHILETWDIQKSSQDLINNITKIINFPPTTAYNISKGIVIEDQDSII